jgi:hypothetical protein
LFRIDGTELIPVISPAELKIVPYFAIENSRVMFSGGDEGVWVYEGGSQIRLVGPGDTVDGRIVESYTRADSVGRHSLSGNQAIVSLKFTDGSSGLYLATIPEPSTLVMAATAFAGLAFAHRRWRLGRGSAAL